MTKSTITRERIQQIFLGNGTEPSASEERELARIALAAMEGEPVEMPLDYLQGHKDGLEWAAQLAEANHPETGDWLYDDPIELAKAIRKGPDMQPAQPVEDSEPDRNPVLAYADSYRDMAKQGVESVPIWSVITDIERNIAPLYRHAQPAPVVPNGLRLALSNAGIAAPESDEMLAATCEKHIQALVTWVRDRKPFQSAPVVMDDRKLRSLFDSWFASDCSFDLSPEASEEDNIAWRESYWYVWQRCRAAMLQAGNSPIIPDGYVMVPKEMTDEIGEAIAMQANCCGGIALDIYDAMLAAAPHDIPALNSLQSVDSVADRWIPVSERLPEDRTQVILWDAEIGEVTSGHYSHKTHTFYHCGDAIENEITHWMAPPAAPQEVK